MQTSIIPFQNRQPPSLYPTKPAPAVRSRASAHRDQVASNLPVSTRPDCPEGTSDNSPAIHCWDPDALKFFPVPKGRLIRYSSCQCLRNHPVCATGCLPASAPTLGSSDDFSATRFSLSTTTSENRRCCAATRGAQRTSPRWPTTVGSTTWPGESPCSPRPPTPSYHGRPVLAPKLRMALNSYACRCLPTNAPLL